MLFAPAHLTLTAQRQIRPVAGTRTRLDGVQLTARFARCSVALERQQRLAAIVLDQLAVVAERVEDTLAARLEQTALREILFGAGRRA